jgi:hypothetical protein
MWGCTWHNTSSPSYRGHTAHIQPSPDGLIWGVTGPSTVPSKWFLKARRDGYGTRITAARIPVYTDTVLSPTPYHVSYCWFELARRQCSVYPSRLRTSHLIPLTSSTRLCRFPGPEIVASGTDMVTLVRKISTSPRSTTRSRLRLIKDNCNYVSSSEDFIMGPSTCLSVAIE